MAKANQAAVAQPVTPSKKSPKKPTVPEREVIYQLEAKLCIGEEALTCADAKMLLGWEEVKDGVFDLIDENKVKVRLTNNPRNRPYQHHLALAYLSEILNGHWQLNGENLIIGKTGVTISAQHRLVGLILACQRWAKAPKEYPRWETEPRMETFMAFGVDETDKVINTVDTGRPRTLADALARSEYFQGMETGKRLRCAKYLAYAILTLLQRTGERMNALSPKIVPHADSIDFLTRHERLLKCVKHVFEEDASKEESNKIGQYVGLGTAAALMYLMASSSTAPDSRHHKALANGDSPTERMLNMDRYSRAEAFWTELAGGEAKLDPIKQKLARMTNNRQGQDDEMGWPDDEGYGA